MTEPTSAKADIVPYTAEFSAVVRSWIDSDETLYYICRSREFPPSDDLVDSWQRPDVTSFLLFSERKPVAYGELWPRPAERAIEIAHLIVDPYKRSQGFGTKLLHLLYQQAGVRRDVGRVVINLYNDSEVALGCYLKAGFELTGTATHTMGLRMARIVK